MAGSLYRSTAVVSAMTLLSRVSGMLRDTLLAVLFAAGAGMDAFLVAFKIPNFLRRIFAEGAFSTAFVPVLSTTKATGTEAEVRALVDAVTGTLAGILAIVTVLGVLAAPLLIWLFAPGFQAEAGKFELATELLRLTFPYIFFISLVSLAGGVLNSYGQFAIPAVTPVLLNVCLIFAAAVLSPLFERPIEALAVGVFLAGLAQLLLQWPALRRIGMLPRPRWGLRDASVQKILRLMLPVMFASSVSQIALLLDTIIASFLPTGSVSWLYYADRLMEFPLGIFTIAISTVILPSLSAQHANKSPAAFSQTLDWALRLLCVIGMPAMLGLAVLSGPLVICLFHYQAFTTHDVEMASSALMAFSIGFMGFSLVKVLLPGFYARQDTRTPVRIGLIALCSSMSMSVLFVGCAVWLKADAPHVGLALSVSLGAFVNAGLLFQSLRRSGAFLPQAGWRRLFGQVLLAGVIMVALLVLLAGDVQSWLEATLWQRLARLVLVVATGAVGYFVTLYALGWRLQQLRLPKVSH